RGRQADGRAHPGGGARAPVHGDRADEGKKSQAPYAARPRSQFLSEAGSRRLRGRRLGDGHAAVLSQRRAVRVRAGAATAERIPKFGELGLKQLINGPIPVSPDGEPIMGQAIERDNVFVACGFTSGIAAAGGAGRAMAEWIVQGYPEMDLWPFDLRRFGDFHSGTRALHERAVHAYGSYYHLHYPGEELTVARDARRSPLWQILK